MGKERHMSSPEPVRARIGRQAAREEFGCIEG